MLVNQQTGFHYIHVFFHNDATYSEIYESYLEETNHTPWMSVITIDQFRLCKLDKNSPYHTNPSCVYILWIPEQVDPPEQRKSKIMTRFNESIGHISQQHLCHTVPWEQSFPGAQCNVGLELLHKNEADILLSTTKFGAEYLRNMGLNAHFAPIGYNPTIMGIPDFTKKKDFGLVYYGGSNPGDRRQTLLPKLMDKLCITDISGNYGLQRQKILDRSKAVLHISQAENGSFESMRLWHAIASSAVLFAEEKETYPAIPNRHYIQIPKLSLDNLSMVVELIQQKMQSDLSDIAKLAHQELSTYTIRYCMDNYIVPLSATL